MKENNNNKAVLNGTVERNFEFNHECFGERFYQTLVRVNRKSEKYDLIPIVVSERLIDVECDWKNCPIDVVGEFRSFNFEENGKSRLQLYLFVTECKSEEYILNLNKISLDGYICKKPIYRQTPLGREIADLLLAVNRPYGKSDYIPCICWGRSAKFAGDLEVGTRIKCEGRIQNREYQKKISDNEFETRTAYEVSVGKLEIVENEQREDFK